MAHSKAHVRWDLETKSSSKRGLICRVFVSSHRGYRGNSCILLKCGQGRRRAHFSQNSRVVWAVTQQARKWKLLSGLFQYFIYFGISRHWINIHGREEPSLSFPAQCILGSFLQHICFLSVTQQLLNYFSQRETWDLSCFPDNNRHMVNPAESRTLQKKGIVKASPSSRGGNCTPQCTCGLMLAAGTSFCCQACPTLVRRIKYTLRSGSIYSLVGKRRGNPGTEWKVNKEARGGKR